ncbi:MAG: PQQ-dependent sugar dehydrogenase [Bacteroidetes bacterium]|nr:PQQ-dependent sugar dehydrogenase [Bacteroidota bacterium]
MDTIVRIKLHYILLLFVGFATALYAQYELENAFPNLVFTNPIGLYHAGDGTDRIFVIEQEGKILVFPNSSSVTSTVTFLDITDRVSAGGERGLLGLAFHPNYANNGYFYVNYTVWPRATVVSRFQVSSENPDLTDNAGENIILTFSRPYSNHNGGWIAFGPDGYLYIASGDGGSSHDPHDHGQNITTFMGAFLRIDVDNKDPGLEYAIPPDNPFADSTGNVLKEIYAWGFRNPWRNSFDPVTGWLWAADVGQGDKEEIDLVESGKNYGWRCYEGFIIHDTTGCDYPEYTLPIWEYDHDYGCSITGGYVYRGSIHTGLVGKYIYADYCDMTIWALQYDGITPVNETLLTAPGGVVSFGIDMHNELYVLAFFPSAIYKFTDPLPVELVSFKGEYINSQVIITWETATEIMNYGFDLERYVNSNGWNKIAFIPGNGNSNSPKYYNYTDTDLQSAGVFKYRLKQIDTDGSYDYSNEISVNVNKPNKFLLEQNYPNPFNPNTRIFYSIPAKAFVIINIYDVLGNEVATLINEEKNEGRYEVLFNANGISSGIYYYRMQANEFVDVKKMIILK